MENRFLPKGGAPASSRPAHPLFRLCCTHEQVVSTSMHHTVQLSDETLARAKSCLPEITTWERFDVGPKLNHETEEFSAWVAGGLPLQGEDFDDKPLPRFWSVGVHWMVMPVFVCGIYDTTETLLYRDHRLKRHLSLLGQVPVAESTVVQISDALATAAPYPALVEWLYFDRMFSQLFLTDAYMSRLQEFNLAMAALLTIL